MGTARNRVLRPLRNSGLDWFSIERALGREAHLRSALIRVVLISLEPTLSRAFQAMMPQVGLRLPR